MSTDLPAILKFAKTQQASDVHICPEMPPLLRLHGKIVKLDVAPLSRDVAQNAIFGLMSAEQRKAFDATHDIDFALEIPEVARFRANVFLQRRGVQAAFRLIPAKVKSLDELGMPPVLKQLAQKERGLVLVTGTTGSGKSTTLAAMIDYINETESGHILTIEDPIEFVHEPKRCLVSQREVGA
ncbi:MAG TPA: ATPase, T2SS/T4P/T4SS family, partial [Candidatus Udaeobacter sp.]|nr:ATPase, T2SS/T4P/T4SS family [Candidatus Udaeobacter sp.]